MKHQIHLKMRDSSGQLTNLTFETFEEFKSHFSEELEIAYLDGYIHIEQERLTIADLRIIEYAINEVLREGEAFTDGFGSLILIDQNF